MAFYHFVLLVELIYTGRLVYGQDTPEITEPVKPEYKPAGGTAYLNCTVQHVAGQTDAVSWGHIRPHGVSVISKDDGIILDFNPIVNGEEKYDILVTNVPGSTNKKVYHLVVRSLVAEDSGTYLCEVRIQGTFNYPSSRGQLFVLESIPKYCRQEGNHYSIVPGTNCRKFYQENESSGVGGIHNCPGGLMFNTAKDHCVCDYPTNTRCADP